MSTDTDFDVQPGLPDIPETDPSQIQPDQGQSQDSKVNVSAVRSRLGVVADLAARRHKNFSKLSDAQCKRARNEVLHACKLMLQHPANIHYTQGPDRWEGINKQDHAAHGQYPKHGDCSSTATWILWCALYGGPGGYHLNDLVNRQNWQAGYTGTMLQHGRHIKSAPNLKVGDLVIYGPGTGEHVAVYIGGGYVFSHGSEGGPYKLRWNYRSDVNRFKRYI